jgi:hypothetical protein
MAIAIANGLLWKAFHNGTLPSEPKFEFFYLQRLESARRSQKVWEKAFFENICCASIVVGSLFQWRVQSGNGSPAFKPGF